MEKLFTAGFYGICFLALLGTIYRLIMTCPPLPGTENYILYQVLSAIFSIIMSGTMIILALRAERLETRIKRLQRCEGLDGEGDGRVS